MLSACSAQLASTGSELDCSGTAWGQQHVSPLPMEPQVQPQQQLILDQRERALESLHFSSRSYLLPKAGDQSSPSEASSRQRFAQPPFLYASQALSVAPPELSPEDWQQALENVVPEQDTKKHEDCRTKAELQKSLADLQERLQQARGAADKDELQKRSLQRAREAELQKDFYPNFADWEQIKCPEDLLAFDRPHGQMLPHDHKYSKSAAACLEDASTSVGSDGTSAWKASTAALEDAPQLQMKNVCADSCLGEWQLTSGGTLTISRGQGQLVDLQVSSSVACALRASLQPARGCLEGVIQVPGSDHTCTIRILPKGIDRQYVADAWHAHCDCVAVRLPVNTEKKASATPVCTACCLSGLFKKRHRRDRLVEAPRAELTTLDGKLGAQHVAESIHRLVAEKDIVMIELA